MATPATGTTDSGWQSGGIQTGTTVSGATPTSTGTNADAQALYNAPAAERLQTAKMLARAGYQVAPSGKFSMNLVNQFTAAKLANQMYNKVTGQNLSLTQYLNDPGVIQDAQFAASGSGGYGAGMGLSRTETTIASPTSAAAIINTVFNDLTGRQASDKEMAKYTKLLQAAQAANPTKIDYASGGKRPSYTIQQGVDPQQFMIQQIAGTDEAQANKVMGFYDAFKNMIGVQ